jgi:hypothetical protein
MSTITLTATQHAMLAHAINNTNAQITWFPDNIKGGARKKVLDALSSRALIVQQGTNWFVAAEGFDALGLPRRGPITLAALDTVIANAEAAQNGASQVLADEVGTEDPTDAEIDTSNDIHAEVEAAVTAIETAARAEPKAPRTRDNSKQATVIGMLKRPEGATIQQIVDSTGWQAHTVRGTFAGAFKKKLGLTITSTKDAGSERVYRIGG